MFSHCVCTCVFFFFYEIRWQKKEPATLKTEAQAMYAREPVFKQSLAAGKSTALTRGNDIPPTKGKDFPSYRAQCPRFAGEQSAAQGCSWGVWSSPTGEEQPFHPASWGDRNARRKPVLTGNVTWTLSQGKSQGGRDKLAKSRNRSGTAEEPGDSVEPTRAPALSAWLPATSPVGQKRTSSVTSRHVWLYRT